MKTLNIRQVRASIGHLDKLVEQSREILVTRYGEPILRILPIQDKHQRPDHADLRQKMKPLNIASQERIREDRDER
jgi:antitoxin (DNA-binding transcriptional repressor) of toxin-antitoxin stability system